MEQGQEKKTAEKSAIIVNFSSSSFEIFLRPCVNSPPPNLSHEKKGKNETKFPENKKYEGRRRRAIIISIMALEEEERRERTWSLHCSNVGGRKETLITLAQFFLFPFSAKSSDLSSVGGGAAADNDESYGNNNKNHRCSALVPPHTLLAFSENSPSALTFDK